MVPPPRTPDCVRRQRPGGGGGEGGRPRAHHVPWQRPMAGGPRVPALSFRADSARRALPIKKNGKRERERERENAAGADSIDFFWGVLGLATPKGRARRNGPEQRRRHRCWKPPHPHPHPISFFVSSFPALVKFRLTMSFRVGVGFQSQSERVSDRNKPPLEHGRFCFVFVFFLETERATASITNDTTFTRHDNGNSCPSLD